MQVAQTLVFVRLGWRALEVPDGMRERDLLRAEQRQREKDCAERCEHG